MGQRAFPQRALAPLHATHKPLLEALTKSPENIVRFFEEFTQYEGIFGKVTVDKERQAHFPLVIIEFKGGERVKTVYEYTP